MLHFLNLILPFQSICIASPQLKDKARNAFSVLRRVLIFSLSSTSASLSVDSKAADNNTSSKNEVTSDEGIELSCSGDINNGFNSGIEEDYNDSRLLSTPLLSDIDERNYPFVSLFAQDVWQILARCDGLYGLTLGSAVQGGGADSIVSWLCSVVWFFRR